MAIIIISGLSFYPMRPFILTNILQPTRFDFRLDLCLSELPQDFPLSLQLSQSFLVGSLKHFELDLPSNTIDLYSDHRY